MGSLTYALGLRGSLRWLGGADEALEWDPPLLARLPWGALGAGIIYVIAVGPVCPDTPRWVQTMTRAQACPWEPLAHREGFSGRGLHRTGGIDLGHPEQGPGGWDHSGVGPVPSTDQYFIHSRHQGCRGRCQPPALSLVWTLQPPESPRAGTSRMPLPPASSPLETHRRQVALGPWRALFLVHRCQ